MTQEYDDMLEAVESGKSIKVTIVCRRTDLDDKTVEKMNRMRTITPYEIKYEHSWSKNSINSCFYSSQKTLKHNFIDMYTYDLRYKLTIVSWTTF